MVSSRSLHHAVVLSLPAQIVKQSDRLTNCPNSRSHSNYLDTRRYGSSSQGGHTADITEAIPLMQGIHASALLADKGCDADVLLAWLNERHVIERMFGKLKYFRRIATRFEKKPVISMKCWLLPPYCYSLDDVNRA